jgi:putative methanogenesis marker protein 8
MNPEELIEKHGHLTDFHLTRIMGAWVAISQGEILEVDRTNVLCSCPLQSMLSDADIETYTLEKIRKFKQFTAEREVWRSTFGVPFGASEMLMFALRKGTIDCAITVCDGAGTVVVNVPEVVQGIGARMNGVFFTSPIPEVQEKLRSHGSLLLDGAKIDQVEGLQKAIEAGFTRIAVTVNARLGERLEDLRHLEKEAGVSVTIAAVCSTGATPERTDEIIATSDLAWACASRCVRERGTKAWLQVTRGIPVFVYTSKGVDLLAAYSDQAGAEILRDLDPTKQYFLAPGRSGPEILLGETPVRLREVSLPVRSGNDPVPLT